MRGEHIEESQMFRSVKGFSPTRKQKLIAVTPKNMIRYVKYLQMRRKIEPNRQNGE